MAPPSEPESQSQLPCPPATSNPEQTILPARDEDQPPETPPPLSFAQDLSPMPKQASTSTDTASHPRKPSDAGLTLRTYVNDHNGQPLADTARSEEVSTTPSTPGERQKHRPAPLDPSISAISHKNSFPSAAASPASSVASPALAALNDITPLPSPINPTNSPEIWRKVAGRPLSASSASAEQGRAAAGFLTPTLGASSPGKKKVYPYLGTTATLQTNTGRESNFQAHEHNRSISEFIPDPLQNLRPRIVTGPGALAQDSYSHQTEVSPLQREAHLAQGRSSADVTPQNAPGFLPSPPPSNLGLGDEEDKSEPRYVVKDQSTGRPSAWKPLRILGTGSFSEVYLASPVSTDTYDASNRRIGQSGEYQSHALVAIKVVDHKSGSDEQRMDTSIKREIEILQNVKHPCLPQLYGFEDNDKSALLVMNYCAGGDLFELASQHSHLLQPSMIQRIFAELVAAVSYLHSQYIVHRDIKLENVLLNLPLPILTNLPTHPQHYPHPLITLTDLGLSKHIPAPPLSPLLTHPCGSIDYAAPEILLGQPYDGRATDAWALGVLLYALLECRLPFDPLPDYPSNNSVPGRGAAWPPARRRKHRGMGSTVKHRIARCDWLWCELGDEEGEWVGGLVGRGYELQGARECVEGLLKKVGRGRWSLERVAETSWVVEGLGVEGGLRR